MPHLRTNWSSYDFGVFPSKMVVGVALGLMDALIQAKLEIWLLWTIWILCFKWTIWKLRFKWTIWILCFKWTNNAFRVHARFHAWYLEH